MCRLVGCVIWGAHTASGVCNLGVHVGVRVLTPGVVPSRGAVCAVVAIRDRVFRLELTFSQFGEHTLLGSSTVMVMVISDILLA